MDNYDFNQLLDRVSILPCKIMPQTDMIFIWLALKL